MGRMVTLTRRLFYSPLPTQYETGWVQELALKPGEEKNFLFLQENLAEEYLVQLMCCFVPKYFTYYQMSSLGFSCCSDLILLCFIIQKCLANNKTF